MKKILVFALAMTLLLCLAACGSPSPEKENASTAAPNQAATNTPELEPTPTPTPAPEPTPEPLDLTGEWKQTNSNSEDSYHAATITEDTIEIYWVSNGGDTKSLYWAGTFEAPTNSDEPYTWESQNDHSKTDSALLASGDDTKTFIYEAGEIRYEASAMGSTMTVRLEK